MPPASPSCSSIVLGKGVQISRSTLRTAEQIPPPYPCPPPHHAETQTARAGDPRAEENAHELNERSERHFSGGRGDETHNGHLWSHLLNALICNCFKRLWVRHRLVECWEYRFRPA